MLKKVLRGAAVMLLLLLVGVGGFVYVEASAFDASIGKLYAVAPPQVVASNDAAVIERGRHLAESIGGCIGCHGQGLGGKPGPPMGPLGVLHAPNLTRGKGGIGSRYTDAQLARVVRDGIKADGHGLRFMPAQDMTWWPDQDLVAIVSYVRSLPPIDRQVPLSSVGLLGKVLDRLDRIPLDVARRIEHHANRSTVPAAAPTREYGQYLARLCTGCHGPGFSGGPIPGAPPSLPVPANITPHETGIKLYTEAQFIQLLDTGRKRNGSKLDPFMPIETLAAMNEVEKRALWAYLSSLPPKPFGQR
jgi:mono/diheme cytochrome c family protein